MANDATHLRRAAKAQWLHDNPTHHEWLRQCTDLVDCRNHPLAADMVASLKRAGIYAPQTVAIDVCAAMRRMAASFVAASLPPSQRATAEIEVILSREGVDRAQILKQLTV